ncbi:MAG: putative DNA primase/helicase [Gammaproteobacteria bacterium]|jgi:putative DNA primase/helicase
MSEDSIRGSDQGDRSEASKGEIIRFPAEGLPVPDGGGSCDLESGTAAPELGEPELVERFGDPVVYNTNKDGKAYVSGINEAFWAGLYASEHVVIYEPDEHLFYQYDSATGLFVKISADLIKQTISKRLLETSREVGGWDRLEQMRTDRRLSSVVSQLRGIVESREFFSNKRFRAIHFAESFLVLFGSIRGPASLSEIFRSRNRSPISYDPGAQCPRFLNELLLPAVGTEGGALVQKMAGQFLLGENLTQRLLIIDGLGERGKTQLANVLQEIVGRANVTQLRTRHLEDRFELSRLLGKTLLIGVDVDADFLSTKGASTIKGLVGGDWFDAERKGSNGSFRFQGNLNIIMTSNSRLQVRLQRDVVAWRRRLLIVRCEGAAPRHKIPKFAEQLIREEGSGIVNWALDGLSMLLSDIDRTGDIVLTAGQIGVVEDLLAESDSIREFLVERIEKRCGSDITVLQLRQGYAEYCADRGWAPRPESQIHGALKSLMRELFQMEQSHDLLSQGKSVRGYHGVCPIQQGGQRE